MILVTGASGLVGCQVVKRLTTSGIDFEALISPGSFKKRPWAMEIIPQDRVIYADLRDKNRLKEVLNKKKYSVVIHLAAKLSGSDVYKVNYYGTKNLIEILRDKIDRFIFVSSILALGDALKQDFNEYTTGIPRTDYEKSKWDAERLIIEKSREYGFSYAIVRPPWIIGEYTRNPDIIFLARLIKRHIIVIPIDKELPIHIIYSGDLAEALIQLVNINVSDIYHIFGERCTIGELIFEIKKNLVKYGINIRVPKPLFKLVGKWIPATRYLLLAPSKIDMEKWIKEVGYIPRVGLGEAIGRTIKWLIENKVI